MGIFDFLRTPPPAPTAEKASATVGAIVGANAGQPIWSPRTTAAYAKEGYVENADVRRAVDLKADAVAGLSWYVAVETADGPAERVATGDWSGRMLPDGQFMDFGFRAVFPDEPGAELTFPVTQRCGSVEKVEPASDGEQSALTVRLGLAFSGEEVAATIASVDDLLAQVEVLQAQTGEVQVRGLRDRVEELEAAREELAQRLVTLRDRIRVIEDAFTVPSAAPTE